MEQTQKQSLNKATQRMIEQMIVGQQSSLVDAIIDAFYADDSPSEYMVNYPPKLDEADLRKTYKFDAEIWDLSIRYDDTDLTFEDYCQEIATKLNEKPPVEPDDIDSDEWRLVLEGWLDEVDSDALENWGYATEFYPWDYDSFADWLVAERSVHNDQVEDEDQFPTSWYMVSPNLIELLESEGEITLTSHGVTWWGRVGYGYSLAEEPALQNIAIKLGYMESDNGEE